MGQNLGIDLNNVALATQMEALPSGWYPAKMIEVEIVETTAKDGFRLACKFEITDGPGKGRKQPCGFNVANPSAEAVRISLEQLKTMRYCMGLYTPPGDIDEMLNKPLQIRLVKQKDSDYNEVKGFKTIDGQDADKVGNNLPPMSHVPAAGFAQPPAPPYAMPDPSAGWQRSPDGAWKLNPATNAWEPNTAPAPPPPPPAVIAAPPAWAPQGAPVAAPTAPPPYAPPAAPGTQQTAPPAWTPQSGPSAPAWTPAK